MDGLQNPAFVQVPPAGYSFIQQPQYEQMPAIQNQLIPNAQGVPGQPVPGSYLQPQQQVCALSREDLVIRVFFQDANIGPKLRDVMRPELFQDQNNRNIVDIIRKYERKHGRIPTAQELITGMGANEYAIQARDKLMFIYNTPVPTMHQDYVVQLIEGYFKERLAEEVLVNTAEHVHDRQVDGIRDLIPNLQKAVLFSLHTDLGINMYADADLALEKLREQKQCIPSGIKEIRHYTGRPDEKGVMAGGGYYRKTLSLFVGQPNIGKSLILCSEAAHAYKHGFNVLYITLELAEDYVWQRLAANICEVDFFDVMHLTGDQARAKIDNTVETMRGAGCRPGQLQVRYMKTTTTPVEIESVIDSFEIAHGKLDLLVVDYIGIMKPARGKVTESSMYNDGVMKAEQLRDIAIERNFACVSAVQFNRSGYHNLEAGIESVEGSSGYSETADLMISITANDVLRSMGMFSHYILKSRLGPAMVAFVTRCDFKQMKWLTASPEEVNAYNMAMADAEPQINANRPGGKNAPRRGTAGQKDGALPATPVGAGLTPPAEPAEKAEVETVAEYI